MIVILLLQLLAPSLSKNHHHHQRERGNATPSATQSPSLPVAALAAPQQGGSGRGPQFLELLSKMGLPGPPTTQEEEEEVDSKRKQVPAFLMEMYRQSDRTFSTGLSSITSFPALHENSEFWAAFSFYFLLFFRIRSRLFTVSFIIVLLTSCFLLEKEEDSRFPFRFDITDLLNSEEIGTAQFRAYKVKGSRTKEVRSST